MELDSEKNEYVIALYSLCKMYGSRKCMQMKFRLPKMG